MMGCMAGANLELRRRSNALAIGLVALAAFASAGEPNAQRVNHFVGAAGESIPIQVPPYHGIEPRLSLSYSSEARNGFAGMGWNLTGFSVIERVNGGWGLPRLDASDTFTLDGQSLVECPPGSAYPSCASGGTHYTHQESYLKVKKVSDVLWQVYGKDGTRTDFEPIHTVPAYEGGPTYSMRLGQRRVVDTHGNQVDYLWSINTSGVNGATYPDSVTYNGYTVQFYRETRSDGPLTRGAFNDIGRQPERLKSVVVSRSSSKIRAYKLSYTTSGATGKSLLTSVQMYGKDAVVDGTGGITGGTSLPAQTFSYQPDSAVASFTGDVTMSNAGPPPTAAGTTENVIWSYRTNTTPTGSGNTLTADAGVPNGWDKVGYSSRALSSGVGHLEFTHSGGQSYGVYLGAYGVYFAGGGGSLVAVGPGIGSNGPFAVPANTVVRIEVAAGSILFKVGATTVFTHAGTPSYPMVAYSSLYRAGDAVTDAKVSGTLVNYFGVDCGGSPRFFGDFNGDGRQDSVCKTALHDLAVTIATQTGFSNPTIWASWSQNIAGVGDFNNDGKDDIVFFDSFWGQTYVGVSNGQSFGAISGWGFLGGYGDGCRMNGATLGKVADYNGDGKMDVACYIPGVDLQYVGISTGTNFVGVLFGDGGCPQPYGNLSSQGQADFNGDGRDDWYCVNTYNSDVYAFFSAGNFFWFNDIILNGFCSVNEYSFGDWNGDGTTDTACANNLRAGLHTGRRFAVLEAPAPAAWCVTGQRLAADLDGDGAAEWICNNPGTPSNDIEVRRWSGLAFGAAQTWRGGFCAGTINAADFNGDGKKDLLCTSSGAVIYAGTKNLKADLMVGTSNGIGGSSSLTWSTTTNSAQNATGGAPTSGLPAKYIVMSTTTNDGRTTPGTTTFLYREGAQDDAERKFFGFATVVEYPPKLTTETESPSIVRKFFTDKLRAGRLESLMRFSGATSGLILSQTKYEYVTSETTGTGARRTALLSAVWEHKYTGLTVACATWPCASGKRTKQSFTYDNFGNLVSTTNFGEVGAVDGNGVESPLSGDETLVTNFYTPNTSAYIVGLVGATNRWTGTSQVGGNLVNSTVNGYDGAADWTTAPIKGALTSTKFWIKEENRYTGLAASSYDAWGNVVTSTDPTGKTMTMAYDTTVRLYPISTTNGAGETTAATWDYVCGVPATTTDLNGLVTTFATDALCRPTTTTLPSPHGVVSTTIYSALGNPATQKTRVETPGPDGSPSWTESFFDGFGRTYKTRTRGPSAAESIVTETDFDARGHVWGQKSPYYENAPGTAAVTTFEYDWFDRPVKTILPDGKQRTISYPDLSGDSPSLFRTITTNELNQETINKFDVFGRHRMTTQVRTLNGSQQILNTTRNYDVLGRMTSLVDPVGNTWTYTYDSLGRNLTKNDPDSGNWIYRYDDAGRLQNYEDAKGQTISFVYDAAGRATHKRIRPTGGITGTVTESVETTYGTSAAAFNKGRVVSVLRRQGTAGAEINGKLQFEYDVLGRVTKQTRTIDGVNYAVERNYDTAGYLRGMKYPDADTIGQFGGVGTALGYDQAGRLSSIPGILTSVTYSALGAPLVQRNGNDTITTKTYDPDRFWLTDVITMAPSLLTIQNLSYTLNDAGMATVVDSDLTNEDWIYEYDALNRLTSATNGAVAPAQTWTYDNIGRITANSRKGTYEYNVGTGVKPKHGPKKVNGTELFYDANGNMTSGNHRTMTWDANNMIETVQTDAVMTTYTYGPDGARIKKDDGIGPIRYPFGDDYEIASNGTVTKYFNAGFGPIAKKVGSTLYWLHTDRLGSINATTDASGAQVLRRSYRAYGELLGQTGTHTESLGYIGQRTDEETKNNVYADDKGLTYLHARYYDSALGVFVSPDPSDPLDEGVGTNRYIYGLGSPTWYRDPFGLSGSKEGGKDGGKSKCKQDGSTMPEDSTNCSAGNENVDVLGNVAPIPIPTGSNGGLGGLGSDKRTERREEREERKREERERKEEAARACAAWNFMYGPNSQGLLMNSADGKVHYHARRGAIVKSFLIGIDAGTLVFGQGVPRGLAALFGLIGIVDDTGGVLGDEVLGPQGASAHPNPPPPPGCQVQ